ncbi:MAG: hypothetical protein H7Y88_10745 [Phycisphaerales bacterium]|nr:hypothetical protein [Phycisphaerales bacterium]
MNPQGHDASGPDHQSGPGALTAPQSLLFRNLGGPYLFWWMRPGAGLRKNHAAALGASLPQPVRELVRSVVRSTRLWRREKLSVARELVAHFHDGLDAGRPPDELIGAFGDPRAAARLIRRAKKRNRPLIWHAWVRAWQALGLLFALLIALYIILSIRFYSGSPRIRVDHLAEINAPSLAIPEADRAWPVYERILAAVPKLDHGLTGFHPLDEDWPLTVGVIDRNQPQIDSLRAAAQMRALGHVSAFAGDGGLMDGTLISVLLPQLGELRKAARLLASDARVALTRGEAERFQADLIALHGVALHAGEGPFLIGDMVSWAIFALELQTISAALDEAPQLLREEHLVELIHRIASYSGQDGVAWAPIVPDLSGERRFFMDLIQRLYTDGPGGDGHLTDEGLSLLASLTNSTEPGLSVGTRLAGPLAAAVVADRKAMIAEYERILSASHAGHGTNMWEARTDPEAEIEFNTWRTARYPVVSVLLPALTRAWSGGQQLTQRRDAMVAVLAMELYQREHGAYPDSLAALTPKYLPAPPIDRQTGEPLKYVLRDGKPVLYSVGFDKDDDGGRWPAGRDAEFFATKWSPHPAPLTTLLPGESTAHNGDWVLWPPMPHTPKPSDQPGADTIFEADKSGG